MPGADDQFLTVRLKIVSGIEAALCIAIGAKIWGLGGRGSAQWIGTILAWRRGTALSLVSALRGAPRTQGLCGHFDPSPFLGTPEEAEVM